ncbi:MAG: ATPase, T2SS/T4P/T4SS family, partial [Planctomycetota bacterium]
KNIITIEDPVEYQLPLINQVQVNEATDLGFATILRQVLRQDPDVIMVGEIRDRETAKMAIQAALTGHLVISTLHTNDSAGAITRLVDMGIEPFLISSALTGVVAQRLCRRVCQSCETTFIPPAELLDRIGWPWEKRVSLRRGSGCKECYDSGYKGRIGIYELLLVDRPMKQAILDNATLDDLRQIRDDSGLPSLKLDGFDRVRDGLTTVEEVMRIVCVEQVDDTGGQLRAAGAGRSDDTATAGTDEGTPVVLDDSGRPS